MLVRTGREPVTPTMAAYRASQELHGERGNARVRVDQGAERRKAGRRLPVAALPMPTIAALHWACLGGGLEFALACDYRLVFDKPNTQLGLGESITK